MGYSRKANAGFTLIEILIASTILFMTVATATVSYRTLLMSNSRAEQVVATQSVFPLVRASVTQSIRDSYGRQLRGEGQLNGWQYQWQAQEMSKNAPVERFDPERAAMTVYSPRYMLLDVQVTMNKDDYTRQFTFTELAWDQDISAR